MGADVISFSATNGTIAKVIPVENTNDVIVEVSIADVPSGTVALSLVTGNGILSEGYGVEALAADLSSFDKRTIDLNDAPAGTDITVTTVEDTAYTLKATDFGFNDPNDNPADSLLAVKITTPPGAGSLKLNGVAVTAGQTVAVADISCRLAEVRPGRQRQRHGQRLLHLPGAGQRRHR